MMSLNPGEHQCPKCSGKGKYSEAHSHSHGYSSQPHHSNAGVSESYAVETVCTRCHGSGKLDWITNAMGEGKSPFLHHAVNPLLSANNNDITFYSNGKTMLEVKSDGFYVQGRKIKDDQKVYDRFNKFLRGNGY